MKYQARFEQFNPFRRPDWRRKRVEILVDADPGPKMSSRKYDDKYVKKYRSFCLKLRKIEDRQVDPETAIARLFHDEPGLYYAHNYYHHPDQEWRDIVEARILAREPDDYIAGEVHTMPETIFWYEKIFFNVRDRIESRSYIVKTILGGFHQRTTNVESTLPYNQTAMCYKLFAYFGGPLVLDIILSGFDDTPMPFKGPKAREFIDNSMQVTSSRKSAMSSYCLPVNKFNVMQLMELHQRFITFESEARNASGGAGSEYEANIEKFFEQIPLAIGEAATEGRTPQTLEFEKTAAEPRAHEQLALAHGEVPDTLRLKLNYERPEPKGSEGVLQDASSNPTSDG